MSSAGGECDLFVVVVTGMVTHLDRACQGSERRCVNLFNIRLDDDTYSTTSKHLIT